MAAGEYFGFMAPQQGVITYSMDVGTDNYCSGRGNPSVGDSIDIGTKRDREYSIKLHYKTPACEYHF